MTITVTLEFSSVAEAIAQLSKIDIGGNPTIVAALNTPTGTAPPAAAEEKAKKPKLAAVPAPAAPPAVASPPTAAAEAAAAPEKTETASEPPAPVDYDTLSRAILRLAAKDKPKVIALYKEWGVANAKELSPNQYAAALARVNATLGETS